MVASLRLEELLVPTVDTVKHTVKLCCSTSAGTLVLVLPEKNTLLAQRANRETEVYAVIDWNCQVRDVSAICQLVHRRQCTNVRQYLGANNPI